MFTRIIDREIPATIVAETDRLIAIEDINPQAPLHVLVIPKTQQYRDVVELAAGDPALLAELVALAGEIAGRAGDSFRLVFNTGADAGQTVFHVHAHVLAGRLEEGTLAGQ
ncbi:Bis(5'-nucleosyl)-tetraphosphatase (asymmetrical) [Mycetocola reblochoni REB411]|uniref:Bis(5'-nucleosyl)-tetraphosphatase (Asymmetrical) n=1 Tax=Mycetocola reblochoni REB411 TaxID=1255698 RepID=A0A1R4K4H0_9MICO|nr:Bis(5'-nucleosyl)-tetraphosphatase (asymmetrical) [Mycetocola reblochoni REB411]